MNNKLNQFERVRSWASERGLYQKGDPKTQFVKLIEEVGETGKAILKQDEPEIKDGLGDAFVVLVNLAHLCGYTLEECIEEALQVIELRTGKMINGTFVKQEKNKVVLKQHKNGYYNFPCKFKDIVSFMQKNNVEIDGELYTETSSMHLKARPSRNGGVAYVYLEDL
tara:strand:+ start:264 stop:764 length:501 start_codon:yes stop_codon:yes gene_type:complete